MDDEIAFCPLCGRGTILLPEQIASADPLLSWPCACGMTVFVDKVGRYLVRVFKTHKLKRAV